MKFKVDKHTNVRKAFNKAGKCIAIYGVAADLLKADVLYKVEKGYEQSIAIVHTHDLSVTKHSTIDDAKNYIRLSYK